MQIRNQQVAGSTPAVGSCKSSSYKRGQKNCSKNCSSLAAKVSDLEAPKTQKARASKVQLYDYQGNLTKRWYLVYYLEGSAERHQVFISQRLKTSRERYAEAERIRAELTNERKLPNLADALAEAYMYKRDTISGNGLRNYSKVARGLMDVLAAEERPRLLSEATELYISDFITHEYLRKKPRLSAASINSYVAHLRGLFGYIEQRYKHPNPLGQWRKLRENETTHRIWPAEHMRTLSEHLKQHDTAMYLAVLLVFHSFLRPIELLRVQIFDIDLDAGVVRVPAHKGKSNKHKAPTLSAVTIEYLRPIVKQYPSEFYLFGEGMQPGAKPHEGGYITKRFRQLRTELGLPPYLKLYGFKHTGNSLHLSAGASITELMAQNGHQEERTTRRYARQLYTKANKRFRDQSPDF